MYINLHNFFSFAVAGVLHFCCDRDCLCIRYCSFYLCLKCGIRETISKRVEHLLRTECLKIAVAHVDIFRVNILLLISKVVSCRIIA